MVNEIKRQGFAYATQSGITISAMDVPHPKEKAEILAATDQKVDRVESMSAAV